MMSDKFVDVKINKKGEFVAGEGPKPMDSATRSAAIVGGSIIGVTLLRTALSLFRKG